MQPSASETPWYHPPISLEELQLVDPPLFTDEDIIKYDLHSHVISLTPKAAQRVGKQMLANGSAEFVVTAYGHRQYRGAFVSGLSSTSSKGVFINYLAGFFEEDAESILLIHLDFPPRRLKQGDEDPRVTKDIIRALRSSKKLRRRMPM